MVRYEEHLFRHFRYSEEEWSSIRAELAKVTGPDADAQLARARKDLLFDANSYIENRAKYGKRIRNPKGARLDAARLIAERARDLLEAIDDANRPGGGLTKSELSVWLGIAAWRAKTVEWQAGDLDDALARVKLFEAACADIERDLPKYRTFSNNKDEVRDRFIFGALKIWIKAGGDLGTSDGEQGPKGPLVRYVTAAIRPVLADETPSAGTIRAVARKLAAQKRRKVQALNGP